MHLRAIFLGFTFTSSALASVLNLNIYTDSTNGKKGVDNSVGSNDQKALVVVDDPKSPRWRRRDTGHLVPLVPEAKSEALPAVYEEGLTYALGPRFANVFIEAAAGEQNGSHIQASCSFLKCGTTILKASPCVLAAIACKCPAPILACPAKLSDICSCVDCLPGPLKQFVQKIGVCSGKFDDHPALSAAADDMSDYPEYIAYSSRSTNLLAYRGDLPLSTLSEAKALAAGGLCPGSSCGDCPCCLGVCVPFVDQCVGACLPIPSSISNSYDEL